MCLYVPMSVLLSHANIDLSAGRVSPLHTGQIAYPGLCSKWLLNKCVLYMQLITFAGFGWKKETRRCGSRSDTGLYVNCILVITSNASLHSRYFY